MEAADGVDYLLIVPGCMHTAGISALECVTFFEFQALFLSRRLIGVCERKQQTHLGGRSQSVCGWNVASKGNEGAITTLITKDINAAIDKQNVVNVEEKRPVLTSGETPPEMTENYDD
ncbi:hypothetical protein L596_004109 [Steinernema carpocapsae]|uniref:Uncharacterized protein n=1 Tax=Steinernema carpocapsae TaxID=34508 RepID=A0A4U8UY89_STECR|nr:hypothetical protein L596_004109 [Steinernema carpocapsae]